MSYLVYKLIHYVGIFALVTTLAAALGRGAQGGEDPWRKAFAMSHGAALFLILLGGFGMLARLGVTDGLPGWIFAKLAIWLVLGGLLVAAKKSASWSARLLFVLPVLAVLAGYVAYTKPF